MAISLGHMLEESCRQWPEHLALLQEETSLTYAELDRAVNSLGNRMRDKGLQKGDKIALMLPNGVEFVVAYFAIQKIGAVAVTLNVLSTAYELRHLLGNSEARGLITTAMMAQKLAEIRNDVPLCTFLLLHDEQKPAYSPFRIAMAAGPFTLEMPGIKGADPAVMIYTAGLTGQPVGAVLTQDNLLGQSYLLKVCCGVTDQDRGLAVIPLFHSFGAVVNMLCVIRVGASVVLMDTFSVDGIFSAIEREKITFIAAVPRLFIGMVMQPEDKECDLSSLKLCISGGAAMPTEFFPRFEARFGVKIMEGYGLTEASPVCAFTRPAGMHKPGSVGPAVPNVEARVVDDEGRALPTGTTGELLIRGGNVMQGYYHDEAATAAVIRDGWLYTGDLARIDEDGYIFLTGLKKRMIITSGFNVY
ncbi:MAG: AMP-binding protein, partial [Deltaproteobacteria bacterium]|nr:AMP-binding protein [Deltaproteobacteria bacterium]